MMRRGGIGPAGRGGARRRTRRRMRRRGAVMGPAMGAPRMVRRRPLARMLALGGTAAVAYHLGKSNVQRIEQDTGRSFDELSEEELANSMDRLDLEVDEAAAAQYQGESEATMSSAPPAEPDYIDELERLGSLLEKGIITDEEFEAKKKQLLGL